MRKGNESPRYGLN